MALAATLASGCATALNLQDESLRKPYGGFTMSVADFFGGGDFGEASSILYWPMWLIDKPFSLLGDTVALPYTLWTLNHASGSAQTKPIPSANDRKIPGLRPGLLEPAFQAGGMRRPEGPVPKAQVEGLGVDGGGP